MVGWFVGAAINLVGSIMINLGTNVMKLGHNKRAQLQVPEEERPPVTKFTEWRIGTAVFVIGNIANFVSFGYAAQSLLAALGSVQFVSNVFFASFVLKEKVTFFVLIATACIIGGCLILVIFGNHSSDDYTVDQLLALYRAPAYIVYLVMMFVFVLGSYILYLHGKHVASQKGREKSFWVAILPVSYSIFSALLGTQSVLFSKSLSVLLRTTISGDSQMGNWYTWVTLVCFLISAGFWVTRLNKGLRLFPAMIIVPLMQICWTLFSIVSGMIYFKEYVAFSPSTAKHGPLNAIMFVLGVMVVFLGVFLLTKGAGGPAASDYEEMDESAKEGQQLDMVDNPAFAGDDHQQSPPGGGTALVPASPSPRAGLDSDVPQKDGKINLDTLRFTSLASNTAILNKTGKGAKRGPSQFSRGLGDSIARSDRDALEHSPGPKLTPISDDKDSPYSLRDTGSMMGTLKKGAKKLQMRLRSDFNVDPEDFKQMFGMGQGGYVPALSLFAMPVVDLTSTKQRAAFNEYGTPKHNASITHALPSSRFYEGRQPHDVEGQLQETKSEDLDRSTEPLIDGPSSHAGGSSASYLIRNASLPGSFTYQQGRTNSSFTGGASSQAMDPGALREIMSKTFKQMEEAAKNAKSSVEASIKKYKEQKAQEAQMVPYETLVQSPSACLDADSPLTLTAPEVSTSVVATVTPPPPPGQFIHDDFTTVLVLQPPTDSGQ